MRTSARRGSKRFRTASVLKDEEELPPPPTTTTRTTSAPAAAPEPAKDREQDNPSNKTIQNSTPALSESKSNPKTNSKKQAASVSEVANEPTDVLPPTTATKQVNGSDKGSTEEDEEDNKSSPLTETSSTSEQMASVAVFAPSADLSQKGTRTLEDLEMGNTESDRPTPDRSSAPPSISQAYMNGQSPESSSLSELDSDDSEAETERLNISPQKPIIGNGTNSATYSTPKKSIGTSTLTSPSRSPSPLSTPGQESPKSPDREMTLGAIEQLTPIGSIAGSPVISPRKRKRIEVDGPNDEDEDDENKDIMEISDLEEDPPKKKINVESKSHVSEDEEDEENQRKGKLANRKVNPSTNGHVLDAEEDSGAEDEDESPRPAQRSPGKNKQSQASAKSSPKKISNKLPDTDPDEDGDEERDTDAADSNHQHKDEEEDEMSKTKKLAAEDLATIEILFAQLRDKIVEERVAEIDKEIAMLHDGSHPELILMSQSIEAHKREKIEKANILLAFQKETAEAERIANRAAIWSQYNQEIRETREKCFSEANTQWWAIHRERRAADTSLSDYVYRIPKSLSTQINHRSRYNAEVSLLSGIAKHVGFPAAPTIMGASTDEVRADLEAMGLVPIQPQIPVPALPPPPPPQHFQASTPSQAGPSRLPQMSTFGPPSAYSPRPAKAQPQAAPPPPQLGNAFQPSPSHVLNPETRHPRSPPSPIPQTLNAFHQAQNAVAPPSPRVTKVTKAKAAAASKASPQTFEILGESGHKRVPIKLENSPTISSLSFAPPASSYVAQQPIDRRMQVGGAPAYRHFGK